MGCVLPLSQGAKTRVMCWFRIWGTHSATCLQGRKLGRLARDDGLNSYTCVRICRLLMCVAIWDTRLRKLCETDLDALILAAAGIKRLVGEKVITAYFARDEMVPAVGQGALGVETREDDTWIKEVLNTINDCDSETEIIAERAMLREFRCGVSNSNWWKRTTTRWATCVNRSCFKCQWYAACP